MRNRRRGLLCAAIALALMACLAGVQAQTPVPVPADVAALAGEHPAEYYRRAAKLASAGKKDDAVFVFYLGQLRYRAHLAARPDLRRDGDPALFGSLSEVVGRPLNEYAFGDIPALARIVDAVLAYDKANPDSFTPPAQFPQVYAVVRDGLTAMKDKMVTDADSIRAKRRQNGLQNRN